MSQPESSSMTKTRDLFKIIMKGGWDEVVQIYKDDLEAQRARITRSGYTVLHLAVSHGDEDVVQKLIEEIRFSPFVSMKNDSGNTPLHIASSMGNARMCELFADIDPTLIGMENNDGETPLFLAALHGKKDAFLCLHSRSQPDARLSYCRRSDGNNILHCAIVGEYFDLAFLIIHLYKELVNYVNTAGLTPLHILASKPSAFKSGSHLGRFQKIVYKILFVKTLEVDEIDPEKKPNKNEPNLSCPQNYRSMVNFFRCVRRTLKVKGDGDESAVETEEKDFLPPNYFTCFDFVKVVYKALLIFSGPGYGGVTNILDEKRKHTWSVQVLDELLQRTDMYLDEHAGEAPSTDPIEYDLKQNFILNVSDSEADGSQSKLRAPTTEASERKLKAPVTARKDDSAILIAAKHGIKEIVEKIIENFPVAIHDTQKNKKNIVLIAVENRRLEVYKLLLMKCAKNEGMFRQVDEDGNGALHFAARFTGEHPRWPIPGDALQMQWEIKWLEFVEESKPKHFFIRYNSENETPDEVFTKTHTKLVEAGGEWMKKTAESCSLVAALIATVAFATSTALPGGVDEQSGKPHLETKPGFQVFAIASLIALCWIINLIHYGSPSPNPIKLESKSIIKVQNYKPST